MDRKFRLLLCLFAAEQCLSSFGMELDHTFSESGSSMFFFQDHSYPRDCEEVQDQCSGRNGTGAHLIRPDGYHEPFWVSCSGEWTVLQRRYNLLLDFDRNWTEYQEGFGYLNAEHWLGNEKIAQLTNQKPYELRIELETKSGTKAFISYDGFRINDEFGDFRLVGLGHRSGIVGQDSLRPHVGVHFSTPDRDNDVHYDPDYNCADNDNAGWWYYNCYQIDLNNGYSDDRVGRWYHLLGSLEQYTSLSYTEMKIRPIEAN